MKRLIKNIWLFLNRIWSKSYAALKKNSYIAVRVTQMLKILVESPLADIVNNIIPTEVDDDIVAMLRKVIPQVSYKVAVMHNILQESNHPSTATDKIITYLKSLNPEGRAAFWITYAGQVNMALSDGKLTFNEAVILTQLAYNELYMK